MYSIQFIDLPKDKITLFHLLKFMIDQLAIDNLIAQTNYLSSMFQSYHDMLLKQARAINQDSKSFESQRESMFESSQSQNNLQVHNFFSNEEDFNMLSPNLNQISQHDQFYDHEIHDRPTGYMRDQEKNEIEGRIISAEMSIELCFKAIKSQLQIRTKLRKKGMLFSSVKEKTKTISSKLKTKQKAFKLSNKEMDHI